MGPPISKAWLRPWMIKSRQSTVCLVENWLKIPRRYKYYINGFKTQCFKARFQPQILLSSVHAKYTHRDTRAEKKLIIYSNKYLISAFGKLRACLNSKKLYVLEAHDSIFCLLLEGVKIGGWNRALYEGSKRLSDSEISYMNHYSWKICIMSQN